MSTIDEIKARIDIVDLVGESVQLRKSGKNYLGFCPFHANTRTPAFVVFPDTGTWRCFGECNEGGDIFKFVMKKEGMDFPEALQVLAQKAGVVLRQATPQEKEKEEKNERLRILLEDALSYYRHYLFNTAAGKSALTYLKEKRGLTSETIELFGLGYAPAGWNHATDHFRESGYTIEDLVGAGLVSQRDDGSIYDRFRNRIMIPIRDASGKMTGFGARILDPNDQPKFLNSPQTALFDKSSLLYGLDRARKSIRSEDRVIIVEGYFDVILPHQCGFTNVVSPMGTALTEQQFRQLKRYSRRMVLAMDPDAAGDKAVLRGIEIARESLDHTIEPAFDPRGLLRYEARLNADIRVTTLPEGLDPDEVVLRNPDEWKSLIEGAKPIVVHVMETLTAGKNIDDAKVKSQIAETVLPLIEDIPNAIERDTYRQRLARLLHIDENTLQRTVVRTHTRTVKRPPIEKRRKSQPAAKTETPRASGSLRANFFLSILMRQPENIYYVNRKLREAGLEQISVKDFQDSTHQAIFRLIRKSTRQNQTEPLDFVQNNLEEPLISIADSILALTAKYNLEEKELLSDLIRAIIKLREEYLKQQFQYLHFLQLEAQEKGDLKASEYQKTTAEYMFMLNRLQSAYEHITNKHKST